LLLKELLTPGEGCEKVVTKVELRFK